MNPFNTSQDPHGQWKVTLNNRCRGRARIEYIITQEGPKHAPTFKCEAQVDGTTWGTGRGSRKVEAELMAAKEAVDYGDSNNKFGAL